MRFAEKALGFFRYLLGKSSEIPDLDRNDVLLGKVVLDIHRKKRDTGMRYVPLDEILPIHPIDREEAIATMRERAAVVRKHREDIESRGRISREFLNQFLPSVSNVKVADLGDGEALNAAPGGASRTTRRPEKCPGAPYGAGRTRGVRSANDCPGAQHGPEKPTGLRPAKIPLRLL